MLALLLKTLLETADKTVIHEIDKLYKFLEKKMSDVANAVAQMSQDLNAMTAAFNSYYDNMNAKLAEANTKLADVTTQLDTARKAAADSDNVSAELAGALASAHNSLTAFTSHMQDLTTSSNSTPVPTPVTPVDTIPTTPTTPVVTTPTTPTTDPTTTPTTPTTDPTTPTTPDPVVTPVNPNPPVFPADPNAPVGNEVKL